MSTTDQSFGIIPLSHTQDWWEVFLIRHKHGRYWGFPKGHAEQDETPEEAATRELKEETNLDIVRLLQKESLIEEYNFIFEGRRVYKRVYYFIAEVAGTVALQQKEISGGLWLTMSAAMTKLTHKEGKAILTQVVKTLA